MPPSGSGNPSTKSCRCPEAIPPGQDRTGPTKVIQDATWNIYDGGIRIQVPPHGRFSSSGHVSFRTATAYTRTGQPVKSAREQNMIDEPAESNMECHVLGVNSLSKKASSAPRARIGHSRPATRCMRRMDSWNISDGVSRHSSFGGRAAKGKPGQPNCRRVLGEEDTLRVENKKE